MKIGLIVLWCVAASPFVALAAGCGAGEGPRESVESAGEAVTKVCGAPSNGPVQGVDVSEFQGSFDWAAAKASGTVFGYARISDGTGHVDGTFPSNWANMKAAGVLRGAYQFFEPGEDEVAQANMMVQATGALGDGDLPCMIDVEAAGGQSAATIAAKVQRWIDIVHQGTGKPPIIYTGAYFWEASVGAAMPSVPLWIAAYGPTCPSVPNGWPNWLIWQYSDGNGSLDHDVFNGSLSDLQALAGAAAPEWPVPVRNARLDVDGDGRADVCARSAAGIVCDLASGEAFPKSIAGPAWSDAQGWAKPEYFSTIQFGDIDGDGKADVCARAAAGMTCAASTGSGFGATFAGPSWSDAQGWAKPQYYATIQMADVNGDGKADLCGRAAAGIVCDLSNGSGFPTEITGPAWGDANGWGDPKFYTTIQFADVNGDGKADVCGRAAAGVVCNLSDGKGFPTEITGPAWSDASGWGAVPYGSTVRFVDIEGDGKSDVCGRAVKGVVCHKSTGAGFGDEIAGPAWSDATGWAKPEYFTTIRYADVNGDGKADVCARAAAGMICELSNGDGFPTEIAGPGWSDAGGWNKPQYYATIGAGDVDGDGKDDLCARAAAGITCARSTGNGFGPTFDGPAWSDASGWGGAPYYTTVRMLGAAKRAASPGRPGAGGGDGGGGGSNGPGAGSGGASDGSNGVAASTGDSSGCQVARRSATGNGLALVAIVGAATFTSRRRRGPRRPAP